jgi:rsbT co-antagonist protein RsbR
MGAGTPNSLDDFFACCPALLFSADRDGAVLRLSKPLTRVLGPDFGRGAKLVDRIHPDDRRVFRKEWTRIRKSAEPVQFDCRLKDAGGSYHAWSWHAQTSTRRGTVHGFLRSSVAAHTQLIEQLEQQAYILRLLQENVPVAVWAIDQRGIFIHHDGKALADAGLTAGQWIGKDIFEIYGANEAVRRALSGEVTHSVSEAHGLHWENWQIPVRDEQGQVTAVVGISLDISQAKRAEMELRTKLELIERQQQVIRALSMPIIEVWDRVVTLPLLGVLDSGRAAEIMETLLPEISKKGARFAVLDLTGVDAVDTATAAHLIRLIQAIRLLGAMGIVSGIRPPVAQTMVSLGIDLKDIGTFGTLREALRFCMTHTRDGGAALSWGSQLPPHPVIETPASSPGSARSPRVREANGGT